MFHLNGMSLYSALVFCLSITDDMDDPLDDLLNKLDGERPKSVPSGKAGKQPTSSPAGQKKEEQGNNVLRSAHERVPIQQSSLQEPVQEPRSLDGRNQS